MCIWTRANEDKRLIAHKYASEYHYLLCNYNDIWCDQLGIYLQMLFANNSQPTGPQFLSKAVFPSLTGYCTISDYNKQNSVTMFWPLNGH